MAQGAWVVIGWDKARGEPLSTYSIGGRASSPHVLWCWTPARSLCSVCWQGHAAFYSIQRAKKKKKKEKEAWTQSCNSTGHKRHKDKTNKKPKNSQALCYSSSSVQLKECQTFLKWNSIRNIFSDFPQCLRSQKYFEWEKALTLK